MAKADMDNVKTHLKVAHEIAHGGMADAEKVSALKPHLYALHKAMGSDSPFPDSDGDYDGDKYKAAVALHGQIVALSGKPDSAQALAVLNAWKANSDEVTALRARVAKMEGESAEREFNVELDRLEKVDGKIPPAADHPTRKYALSLKPNVAALKTYGETLKKINDVQPTLTGDPRPAADATKTGSFVVKLSDEEKANAKRAGIATLHDGAKVEIDADDKRMAKKFGIPLDQYLTNKARITQRVNDEGADAFRLKPATKSQDAA